MKKDELVKNIEEGMKTEERAIAIYLEHLDAIILRSGLSKEDLDIVRGKIEFLIAKNEDHKERLEDLLLKIKREDKDVY